MDRIGAERPAGKALEVLEEGAEEGEGDESGCWKGVIPQCVMR